MGAIKLLWRHTTWLDRWILALLLGLTCASWAALTQRPAGTRIVVERDGTVLFTSTLRETKEVFLDGPAGGITLVVAKGGVRVREAGCRDKICVRMASISRAGEWIACVPNRLIVRVEGAASERKDYDLLSR